MPFASDVAAHVRRGFDTSKDERVRLDPVHGRSGRASVTGLRTASTLIVIPAYNEELALPGVLSELRNERPDCDVLVVVDGATDRTAEVARKAGVIVAELPFNLGIGGALRTGFKFAAQAGYLSAVQFDADGQHDPAEIDKLLDALDGGADMVVGSRFAGSEQTYDVGRLRGRAMRLLRFLLRTLSGVRFSDTSSGFRAFNSRVIEFFARTYPVEYMDSVEALLLACYEGFNVVEIPTRMRVRSAGVPSNRNVRLAYHYVRLLIVLFSSVSLRRRRK
jgi:glycosyltransferase involved in cell wall biosynthesis